MPRYRLTLEYDGRPFAGWQRQGDLPTVQRAVEAAVGAAFGEAVTLVAAGRTDAGVHALAQVAHLDLARPREPRVLREALNFHLRPDPVVVLAAEAVADGFNARFSATGRAYLYRILVRPARPALDEGRVWFRPRPHDLAAMRAAAAQLLGRHDFSSFRAAQCQAKSPLRTLDRLDVEAAGEEIHIRAAARSFLHNQVRIMVGTLAEIGVGRRPAAAMAAILAARDRAAAGQSAPPHGLYLTAVSYPSAQPVAHVVDEQGERDVDGDDA